MKKIATISWIIIIFLFILFTFVIYINYLMWIFLALQWICIFFIYRKPKTKQKEVSNELPKVG